MQGKKIFNNVVSQTFGQVYSLVLTFLSFTFAARYLGVDNFGQFSYVLAIALILSKIVDFGFSPIVFRELSIDNKNFSQLDTALSIRLISLGLISILFAIGSFLFQFAFINFVFIELLLLNTLFSAKFSNFRELLELPFKVALESKYPVLVVSFENTLLFLSVLLMIYFNFSVSFFIVAYVIVNIPGFILILYLLNVRYSYKWKFRVVRFSWLMKSSIPIFIYILFDAVLQQVDIFFLSYYHNEYEIGIYSAAQRLITPLIIIPTAIIHSFFPSFSRMDLSNETQNDKNLNVILKIILLIPITLTSFLIFNSSEVVTTIYSLQYKESHLITLFLSMSQLFFYFNFLILNYLVANSKQNILLTYSYVVVVLSVVIDFIVVPQYAGMGAAIGKVFCYMVGSGLTMYYFKREYKSYSFGLTKYIYIVIPLSLYSMILSYLHIFVSIIVFILLCLITIISVRYFNLEEIKNFLNLIGIKTIPKFLLKLYR